MKAFFAVLVHIVTNVMLQASVLALMIWYYDVNVREIILSGVRCAVLLLADCLLSKAFLRREKVNTMKWLHFFDLILALPGMWIAAREIALRGVHMPKLSLCAVIFVYVVDALLVAERIALVKKRD